MLIVEAPASAFLDSTIVPVSFLTAFIILVVGGGVNLARPPSAVLERTAAIFLLTGALSVLVATLIHAAADAQSAGELDATNAAYDYPATLINIASSAAIVASLSCFTAAAFGAATGSAARILLVVGAAVGLAATTLLLLSELHRARDVAQLVLALRDAHGEADVGAGVDARQLGAALDALEARHASSARRTARQCGRRCCRGDAGGTRPSLRDLARAASPYVAGAESVNVLGAASLLAAAVVLLSEPQSYSGAILLEVAFACFAVGTALVLLVGARKVAAHRRGGRAHLEYDVRKALLMRADGGY